MVKKMYLSALSVLLLIALGGCSEVFWAPLICVLEMLWDLVILAGILSQNSENVKHPQNTRKSHT